MRTMSLVAIVLAVMAVRGDEPKAADEEGLKVGQGMIFHVADFVNGKPKGHAGCPSVMISNADARGLIVWARGANDPAFRLTAALDAAAADGDKLQRFLVVFDADKEAITKKAKGIGHVVVGKARHAAKEGMDRRGVEAKTSVLVFLLDKKMIKATWSFAADDLTDEQVKKVVAATKKFAAGD